MFFDAIKFSIQKVGKIICRKTLAIYFVYLLIIHCLVCSSTVCLFLSNSIINKGILISTFCGLLIDIGLQQSITCQTFVLLSKDILVDSSHVILVILKIGINLCLKRSFLGNCPVFLCIDCSGIILNLLFEVIHSSRIACL